MITIYRNIEECKKIDFKRFPEINELVLKVEYLLNFDLFSKGLEGISIFARIDGIKGLHQFVLYHDESVNKVQTQITFDTEKGELRPGYCFIYDQNVSYSGEWKDILKLDFQDH